MRTLPVYLVGLTLPLVACAQTPKAEAPAAAPSTPDICWPAPPGTQCFSLKSAVLAEGVPLPVRYSFNGFGCTGQNISPPLVWSSAPKGTKSFAITLHDPDAPTGGGWWHWLMVNIPASANSLPEGAGNPGGALPVGAVMGRNDFGTVHYGGPCPPAAQGMHRYQFTVWALGTEKLDVTPALSGNYVGFLLNANVLGKAVMTIPYTRN